MNHLKRKLQEIIHNIDDSICAMSATPGTSSGEASRAVKKGQEGNSQTETVSFATRAADNFRYLLFFIVYFVFSFAFFIFAQLK